MIQYTAENDFVSHIYSDQNTTKNNSLYLQEGYKENIDDEIWPILRYANLKGKGVLFSDLREKNKNNFYDITELNIDTN